MTPPAIHVHISEREVAHDWPDGQHDDGAWEDCTYCAGLELARLCFDAGIPATHAEAELLRDASGKPPTKGANTDDLIRGLQKRYGWLTGYVEAAAGYNDLRANLKPGFAAAASGRTAAFPPGHRLRRFDPTFVGGHRVLLINDGDPKGPWWCDPLAPKGAYRGERVTWAEVRTYVLGFGGTHLVAPMRVTPPDTGTGDDVAGIDFECVRVASGTFTFGKNADQVMLPTNGAPGIPAPKDYVRNTFAEIVMTGDLYTGRRGWLAGQGAQAVICMEFVGKFKPTPVPAPPPKDCSAEVAAAVASANARIAGIKRKTATFAADVEND